MVSLAGWLYVKQDINSVAVKEGDHRFGGTVCSRLMTSLRSLMLYFFSLGDQDTLPSKSRWPHGEKIPEQNRNYDRKEERGQGC